MPEYNILVKLIVDPNSNIQQQINSKINASKPVQVNVKPNLNTNDLAKLENQWIRWKNKLSNMQSAKPMVFGTKEVQDALENFKSLEIEYKKGNVTKDTAVTSLNKVTTAYTNNSNVMKSVTHDGYGFSEMLGVGIKKMLIWAIAGEVLFGTVKKIEEAFKFLADLNKELTNIQIVTGASTEQIRELGLAYNDLAISLGITTLEVTKGSLEWARQGKTAAETTELLTASIKMAKLGNLDQAQSTEYLTSIINGYKLSLNEVMPTIDKLIVLDNNYATSVS